MPKTGTTLSERIAALQRKTSNPVPSRSGGLSPDTSYSSSSGRLSPGDSPSRLGGNTAANAVRDRIAKFQGNDERPLVPRSAFGVGAPNPELLGGARRGYPGSTSKGSGAWGEGVLRPQMTGGVWLGGGSGGGWGDPATAPMRPQLTGGAFGTSPNGYLNSGYQSARPLNGLSSSSMHRGASAEAMPDSGRDAFADLADRRPDILLTGRNKPDSDVTTPVDSARPLAPGTDGSVPLPQLPDPPATEIDPAKARAARDGLPTSSDGPFPIIPEFPTTPSTVPETPKKLGNGQLGLGHSTPDTSIEIGVHGKSPEDVEKLRRKVRDLELEEIEALDDRPLSADAAEPWVLQPRSGPAGQVPKALDSNEVAEASSTPGKSDEEPWVQGYGKPDAELDTLAVSKARGAGDPRAPGDLPQRAQVERTASRKADPADPNAHKVMGAGLLVPRDEVAEAKAGRGSLSATSEDEGLTGVGASMVAVDSTTSDNSAVETPDAGLSLPSAMLKFISNNTITASTDRATFSSPASGKINSSSLDSPSNGRPSTPETPTGKGNGNGSGTAGPSSTTTSPSGSRVLSPAERARQAVAEGRSKSKGPAGSSQRLRRPPPGTVLSAADLDASDDDYEPGWASVISSSRS